MVGCLGLWLLSRDLLARVCFQSPGLEKATRVVSGFISPAKSVAKPHEPPRNAFGLAVGLASTGRRAQGVATRIWASAKMRGPFEKRWRTG